MSHPRPDFVKDSYRLSPEDQKKIVYMSKEEFFGSESERLTKEERDEFFGAESNTNPSRRK